MTYVCDPKKSFVIKPKEGEINYEMHEKKPTKFYREVLKQKVTEHKVSKAKTFEGDPGQNHLPKKKILKKGKSLELRSRVTIRALCRVISTLQRKLVKLM